jgi:hypothetical protein
MSLNFLREHWEEIIEKTRENYLNSIKVITLQQNEIEKLISSVIKHYSSLSQEQINTSFEWIKATFQEREDYINKFKFTLYENLAIMPNVEDVIFKKHFTEIYDSFKEFYKKITLH